VYRDHYGLFVQPSGLADRQLRYSVQTVPTANLTLELERRACGGPVGPSGSGNTTSRMLSLVAVAPGLMTAAASPQGGGGVPTAVCVRARKPAVCALANDGVCDELKGRCKPCVLSVHTMCAFLPRTTRRAAFVWRPCVPSRALLLGLA
jgi:hypothetical protein